MSNVQSILKQDPYYLEQRRKELQPYLDLFSRQLFHIYCYMPCPKRIIDWKTGECEIINDEKWQAVIDKVKEGQMEILESSFPEFYPEKAREEQDKQ